MRRHLLIPVLALLCSITVCCSQDRLSEQELLKLMHKIDAYNEAASRGEGDLIAAKTHPRALALAGGKEQYAEVVKTMFTQLTASGMKIGEAEIGLPKKLYRAGTEEICFVPTTSILSFEDKKARNHSFLVAARQRDTTDWLFIDGFVLRKRPELLWSFFPELTNDVDLPQNEQIMLKSDEPETLDPIAVPDAEGR